MRAWRVLTAVALFVALLALASGARAEEQIDPAAVAKAKELLAVTKTLQTMSAIMDPYSEAVERLIEDANPGRGPEVHDFIQNHYLPELRKRLPEATDILATEYARYFTLDDMDKMIAFYRSDVGQKFIALQPKLLQETFKLGQAWGDKVARDVYQKMEPWLKKRGLKSPNI